MNPLDQRARSAARSAWSRLQHHESGQIARFAADPVGDPRSHARPPETDGAGVHETLGGRVIEIVGRDSRDERHIVDDARNVRQQVRDPPPALAVLFELARRAEHLHRLFGESVHEREALARDQGRRNRLAVVLPQLRLVFEHVELARSARHEQVDDVLDLGRKVRRTRLHRQARFLLRPEQLPIAQDLRERNLAEAYAAASKKLPPRLG